MSLKSIVNCLKFSLSSVMLLFWLGGLAQGPDFSGVDRLLEQNSKALGKNIIAEVYKDSALVYKKEMGEYFTGREQVLVAGCSKWLTAALVMTFVDQGKIKLDEPLGRYLPVLEKYFKGYITLRNCLTNSTGIENDQTKLGKLLTRKKFLTLEDEANYAISREIRNNPGKDLDYGDVGMIIAARVCEVIGKRPFERLMQERITRPLRMRGTTFFDMRGGATNPSEGATSTANDIMNFLIMILHKGAFMNKRILSEAAVAEMEKPQFTNLPVFYAPPQLTGLQFGLGSMIDEGNGTGRETLITCPSLRGTWPYIDRCRGYAAILLVKNPLDESSRQFFDRFKAEVDGVVGGCR